MFGRPKKAQKVRKETSDREPDWNRRADGRSPKEVDFREFVKRLVNDSE